MNISQPKLRSEKFDDDDGDDNDDNNTFLRSTNFKLFSQIKEKFNECDIYISKFLYRAAIVITHPGRKKKKKLRYATGV